MPKLHQLTGQIINKESRKVYNKVSSHHGNTTYKLTILNQNKEDLIFVYPNIVSPEIFQIIEQSQYLDKRYLFFCEKKPKRWVLHDWKELTLNLDTSLEKLNNYEQEK